MNFKLQVHPNEFNKQTRIEIESEKYLPYTGAYIGECTYCFGLKVDNGIEFEVFRNRICYNLQIGKYNSIGQNLECVFGRNHNYKNVSTGAVDLLLQKHKIGVGGSVSFNQKGSIIIQNDVWFGENVTVMPGTIIRNGAIIARNSHVVADVPPYAIVGGNPARIIGYRYPKEYIDKLQKIAWWDWPQEQIVENASFFTEDVAGFCNAFFDEADKELKEYVFERNIKEDIYFAFVDYYENYSNFSHVMESFLDRYYNQEKKLMLFIQEDNRKAPMSDQLYSDLTAIVESIQQDENIRCSLELVKGTFGDAKKLFLNCSHYITTRVYDTVYFSCLADQLGIEILSGTDSSIQFERKKSMYKEP